MEYIKIGQITKAFGIKGEVRVFPYTGFIEERFKVNNEILLYFNNEYLKVTVEKVSKYKNLLNIKFKEYNNINDIEKFNRSDLYIHKSNLHKLANGEYYVFELIGLKCNDQNNNYLGEVIEVVEGIAHNNLRIKNDDRTFLVPNISEFVKKVDLENKLISINVIEGLL